MRSVVVFFIGMLIVGVSNLMAHQLDAVKGTTAGDAAKSDPQGVVIGTGTAVDKYLPVAPWWGYSYTQTIYLQQEINVSGQIKEISYYYNGGSAWTDDIVIYMGTTDKSSFTSESDWVAAANLTQVYAGPLAVTAAEGWVTLVLDTPFDYDNSQNLVVAVDENSTGSHNDSDDFYCTEITDGARSLAYVSDESNPDPTSPPAAEDFSGWSPDFIPNTTFGFGNTVADPDAAVSSTAAGGSWSDAATWTNGVVPVTTDSVVISGPVSINGNYSCDQLYVAPEGILENENDLQGYTLTVNGNLVNEGIIRDNPDYDMTLRVLVYEDVVNAGTSSFGELALGGTSSQTIRQTGTQPFTNERMIMWYDATETVFTDGNVTFEGTEISLSNLAMVLNGNLNLTGGGLLSEVSLDGQGYVLNCSENTLLGTNTLLTNIQLDGTIQVTTNAVTFGEGVVNKGVLENGDGLQSYLLEVTGNLVNEGTIRNNSAFETALNIKVLKDLMDTGSMLFGELQVDGSAAQEINFINTDGLTGRVVFYSNLETGGPYQWTKDGNDISGETSENMVFSEGLTPGDAGIYTCVSDGTTSRTITVVGPDVAVDPLPIPFSEGFEEGAEGWAAFSLDDDDATWIVYTGEEAYEGTHAARVEWNSAGNNDWLVSPLLEIPAGASVDVSFMAKSGLESFLESFDVKVISEDGETEDHIASETDVPLSYTEYTYPLDNYAGQNIYVAVVCVSVDMFYLFLDDFRVEERTDDEDDGGDGDDDVSSRADMEHSEGYVQLYPNPVRDRLFIESDRSVQGVSIFDIQGKLVMTPETNDLRSGVDLSGLEAGIYFLHVVQENRTSIHKIFRH